MKIHILTGFLCLILLPLNLPGQSGSSAQGDSISIIVEGGETATAAPTGNRSAEGKEARGFIDAERSGFKIQIADASSPYKLRLINRENYDLEKQFELYGTDTLLSQEFVDGLPGRAYNIWVTDDRKVKFQLDGILGQEPAETPAPVESSADYTTLIIISILAVGLLVFFLLFNKKRETKTMFDD